MKTWIFAIALMLVSATAFAEDEVKPFAQGDFTFQAFGSTTQFSNDGEINLIHLGVGYFLWDDISINFEAMAGDSDGDSNGAVRGFELMGRWHFLHNENKKVSLFVEGGVGLIVFEDSFPDGGSHSNFSTQGGLGLTCEIWQDIDFIVGARWHHISNAGRKENPGFDGGLLYAGLMFTF